MANKFLPEKKYMDLRPDQFISKCYEARCKLLHTGELDDKKFDLNSMTSALTQYMSDIVLSILNPPGAEQALPGDN